jgi:DUF4097 and DUF4098 domain-containing protein YvlB
MKAREIFLALALIAFGALTYYAKSGRLQVDGDGGWLFWGHTEEFLFEETAQALPGPLPRELQVINAHGAVEIRGAETDTITVAFKKSVNRRTREEAQKVADQLKMVVNREDPRLILSTNRDDFRRKNFETRFTITVPRWMPVFVRNSYGPVKIEKTGAADIVNPHGEVSAGSIAGRLAVDGSYEDVDVHDVRGDARIVAPHAKVIAVGVQGELLVDADHGELFLENVDRNVRVGALHSSVNGKNLKGEVEIKNSYEKVVLAGTGPVKIFGHHSDIEAEGIDGPLEIGNAYAKLMVGGVKGDLRIEGANLEVHAERVAAREITISTSYENVEILGFSGKATIVQRHGDVALEPAELTGPIDVRASYSAVRLGWPAGLRAPFEGETKSGVIHWNLADKPSFEETNGKSVTRAYLDAAGPAVKISTSYGDIRIEETAKKR